MIGLRKLTISTRKIMTQAKNRHISNTGMLAIHMDRRSHKSCLWMVSDGKKDKFTFDEELIQDYDEDSDKGYILLVDAKFSKELHETHSDLPF